MDSGKTAMAIMLIMALLVLIATMILNELPQFG